MSYVTESMKSALKNHVLEEVLPQVGLFQAFYLKEPGQGRMMSTLLVFTPEGIVVMGDLCPSGHGSISSYNYGIGWFSGVLSEYYLCSKFLSREWQAEAAVEWVQEHIKEIEAGNEEGKIECFREIERDLQGGCMDATQFHDALEDAEYGIDDELPGYDYPRADAGWLCALQQRFAELYAALGKVACVEK